MTRSTLYGLLASAALATAPLSASLASEIYYTDQGHTEVIFSWNHAGVSVQTGEFTTATGKLTFDPENIANSRLEARVDATSVSTGFTPLDNHLKSSDFLAVENYPEITFVSTSIKPTGETTAEVTGDLILHGTTRPVTLNATLIHRGEHPVASVLDYYRGQWMGFKATTTIDHQDFGVGNFSTGPITITINTELKDRED
ncbi:YceI family protein [Kiloniella sp. b19]|uniref:YceI family protein n=1 Tax=Kiloniella sp. GXU_MW_B19 TaxID=3141326 RepID=UPI0031E0A399